MISNRGRQSGWEATLEHARHEHPDVRAYLAKAFSLDPHLREALWQELEVGPISVPRADGTMRDGCLLIIVFPVPEPGADLMIAIFTAIDRYGFGVFEPSGARVKEPLDLEAAGAALRGALVFGQAQIAREPPPALDA